MKFRAKTLLAKTEAVYGVASVLTGAEAMLTKNLTINPYSGNTIGRDTDRASLGNTEQINTNPFVEITFDVELAGAKAAGTAPAYGCLLRASGFSETVNPTVDVVYQPVSAGYESVTLAYLRKNNAGTNQIHEVKGARGSCSFSLSKEGIPTISFKFIGFYKRPEDVAVITADHTAFADPLPISNAQTSLTIGVYSPIAESISFDMASDVKARNVINQNEVIVTDRKPTGSTSVQAPDVTTKDFFAEVESHNGITLQALQLIHGTTAGNIIQIDAPKVQLTTISEQDGDGELHYNIGLSLVPNAGDDEFVLTIK
jgi:hypothetical protein